MHIIIIGVEWLVLFQDVLLSSQLLAHGTLGESLLHIPQRPLFSYEKKCNVNHAVKYKNLKIFKLNYFDRKKIDHPLKQTHEKNDDIAPPLESMWR